MIHTQDGKIPLGLCLRLNGNIPCRIKKFNFGRCVLADKAFLVHPMEAATCGRNKHYLGDPLLCNNCEHKNRHICRQVCNNDS
jgi:hypothetical protein